MRHGGQGGFHGVHGVHWPGGSLEARSAGGRRWPSRVLRWDSAALAAGREGRTSGDRQLAGLSPASREPSPVTRPQLCFHKRGLQATLGSQGHRQGSLESAHGCCPSPSQPRASVHPPGRATRSPCSGPGGRLSDPASFPREAAMFAEARERPESQKARGGGLAWSMG